MELSSTLSTNLWNRSQSTAVSAGCRVGEARTVRSRVPTTRTCRAKIIVGWFVSLVVGREVGEEQRVCGTAIDFWSTSVWREGEGF